MITDMEYKEVRFDIYCTASRRYDKHILYARMFGEAYNLPYTDVYDFAAKKQSLKKREVELGIHHQELGLPWDKPVPEGMRNKEVKHGN